MKKLLITGCNGMLGGNIASILKGGYEIFGIDKGSQNGKDYKYFNIDITDHKKVKEVISSVNPDYIVHCAALTNVDFCEENYELAVKVNALATKNIVSNLALATRLFTYLPIPFLMARKETIAKQMSLIL